MLSKKHVLISGCNGGIGIEILKLLVKNNAKISISYHKNRDQIDNFLAENKDYFKNIRVYQADLTNDNDLDAMLNSVLKDQPVDIFIHLPTHAYVHKDLMKTTWDDIQNHINLQAKSFFNISKHLVPDMKLKKHGVLVNILTSYVVGKPPSGVSDYVIGKYSLLGLTKSMAVELGKFGIRVNSISPSMVNSPLTDKLPSKLKEMTKSQIPLESRLAEPTEVAGIALFLCSEHANYINGENILVTGGSSMN